MKRETNINEIPEEVKIIAEEIKKELLFLLEKAPYLVPVQALKLFFRTSDSQQQEKK